MLSATFRLITSRKKTGAVIADYTAALVVLILAFIFPFVDLATICLRYGLLVYAVHEGARAAATCSTFESGPRPALTIGPATTRKILRRFSGFNNLRNDTVTIVYTKITERLNQVTTRTRNAPNQKLPEPADANQYVYVVRNAITADIAPLVKFWGLFGARIPGLSDDFPVAVESGGCVCEYTGGLDN